MITIDKRELRWIFVMCVGVVIGCARFFVTGEAYTSPLWYTIMVAVLSPFTYLVGAGSLLLLIWGKSPEDEK